MDSAAAKQAQERPPRLVRADFDFFKITSTDGDIQAVWKDIQDTYPPIFWTDQNGGHWVATRAADIEVIHKDYERFSSVGAPIPRGRRSISSPPIDVDPPKHMAYRTIISPAFSPKAVAALEPNIRKVLREVINKVEPQGVCEFVGEVSQVLPITVFLDMMGLPLEDAERLLPLAQLVTGAQELEIARQARLDVAEYVREKIEDRRREPKDDLLTAVIKSKMNGEPLGEEDLLGMCTVLVVGGLDTVAAMLGFVARFLALSPDHRKQLIDNPQLIPRAVDELTRRFGITNLARVVVDDMELNGAPLRKGDLIQIPNCLFGLDPERVESPLTVDFNRRAPIPSMTFGAGVHVCPGKALARMEIRAFLEEWLPRIPDFVIKPGTIPVAKVTQTNAIRELWLTWTPSKTTQTAR